MSLSFPASPTNGQIYQNWVWSSAVGAWQPNYAAGFVNSFNGRGGVVTLQPGDNTSGNAVLLTSQVVSSAVASVDFFTGFDGSYTEMELRIYDFVASAAGSIYVRFSSDGSTFDTGANYTWAAMWQTAAASAAVSSGATSAALLFNTAVPDSTSYCYYNVCRLNLSPLNKPSLTHSEYAQASAVATGLFTTGGGTWGPTPVSVAKGMRILHSAGNITRGTFKLYGIKP